MKNVLIWIIFSVFEVTKCQMLPPAVFFPPGFVRQEFPRMGPDVDPLCPPFRCPPVPEGCAQSRIIMINGRRCPFCPRNTCADPGSPREQEGNRLVITTDSETSRGSNNSPTPPVRDAEQNTGSPHTGPGRNGPTPRNRNSPFFAPNERRVVRGGQQGVRGRRVNRPSRRRPGTSSSDPRNRPNGVRDTAQSVSESAVNPPKKIPQVENQLNAHDLFPLEPFRDNVISDTKPKEIKKPKPTAAPKPPVTPAPAKAPVSPTPTHGTRSERQTMPSVRLIFQTLQQLGSNTNRQAPANRGQQTPALPSLRSLPGSPFTQVVQQGSQNNGQNSNSQPSRPQAQTVNGIHPLLPLFLMQQARLNNLNAPTPSASSNAPQNNAAQNPSSRNNVPNFQQLPPHLRGMWPFPMLNQGANQNAIPGMMNNMQANQAGSVNAEPTVPPVSSSVQADINQWMDQMAMPIQQVLQGGTPASNPNAPTSGSQSQTNQIQGRQMALPNQQLLNIGQANQQVPQIRGPNQAFLQQWFQQMALQQQRLAAGQSPQGVQPNQIPPIPTLNQLFQNQGAGPTNAGTPNAANPAAAPQTNGAASGNGFSQWLDSLAQQIHQQIIGGSNSVRQPNTNPQMIANNMFPNMNNIMQTTNNAPSPSAGGGQLNFNNWLENMVAPIQQELTGSPQAPSSGDGANLAASSWFNEMLNPIQQGLGGM